jgi:DNA helicase-2/ATP-dependent DNA helicase PcrA
MSTNLLDNLNPEQTQAVIHPQGPALVLAGAGSGKTRVLTTRAAWLMDQKLAVSEQILLVTFTNKAAGEMRERVEKLTSQHLPWSGTFHSLCARMLRIDGKHVGLPPGFTIYDTDDQLSLVKQIYKELDLSTKEFNPKSVRAAISEAKNELITWQKYEQTAYGRFAEFTARIYKIYQHKLETMGTVDFDDLMLKVIKLFSENPAVLNKYQTNFTHVLVDEYQDTNKAQYQLTRFFTDPQQNLFVVGDFSQSIYAWRGADYRNMLQLKTDFPNITEYRLERNYRSTQTILDAATHIIAQNTSHPILELWTDKKTSEPIQIFEAQDGREEASWVIQQLKELQPSYQLKDMAILYRTNAQSREFEEALIKTHLPYRIVGGLKFYERKEIKDILAYLKYFVNPLDEVSLQRATSLGKRNLAKYLDWKTEMMSHYQLEELLPRPLIQDILTHTNYQDRYDTKDPEDLSRLENIEELLRVAEQFNKVTDLLENIALIQNDYLPNQSEGDEHNTVTLMSLHAAKGLEFGAVFMVGMEEGLLPHARSYMDKNQLEEERRLCYVGITRAKDLLHMTYRRRQYSYSGVTNSLRSRFINEIPENLTKNLNPQRHATNGFHLSSPADLERRFVPLDDNTLDMVLSGEMDVTTFLDRN